MATTLLDNMVELLRGSALLAALPDKDLRELAGRVHRVRYQSGDVIFRKGDEGSGMMVVVRGRVKMSAVGANGGEVMLNVMDPGQVFGEMALIDGGPRSTDAIATRDTETITVLRRDFLPILRQHPDAALSMMTVLSGRIRQATQFVEDAIFQDVATRLLHRVQSLVEAYGERDSENGLIRVEHGFTQQDLADSIGLTRVSVNRQLGAWEELSLIRKGRGWLEIPDLERLEDHVQG